MPSASPHTTDERIGVAAAIAAAIIYGAAYPATAVALRSFSPLAVSGLTCTLALAIVIGLAAAGVLPRPAVATLSGDRLTRLIVLALLGGVLFIVAINVAVAIAGPTITGFVAPLYAIFGTLFAVPLLGERVRPTTVVAFALALVGTGLLAGAVPTGAPIAGVALGLVGAAMFGLYLVLARRWSVRYALDGTLITIANLIGRGPVLLGVAVLVAPNAIVTAQPDAAVIVAFLTLVFGSSTTANLLLMAAVRRVSAGRASGALLLTPVSSAVIAAAILGERLTPVGLLGAACILIGMALASGVVPGLVVSRRTSPR